MKTLNYSIQINAPKEKVWKNMIDKEMYSQWCKPFSPNSQYEGEWRQGTYIKFIDPGIGGTKAILEQVVPYDHIHARHVAVIDKEGNEHNEGDMAENWVGTLENYDFKENGEATELLIEIQTYETFVDMFEDGWPKALRLLKDICERHD